MNYEAMESTARALVAEGKGILAADESLGTIGKRFQAIHVENTEENRRAYREMLFTTPKLGQYIRGVILFDETIRQKTDDGTPFAEVLRGQGIIPGIKVDKGAKPLAGFADEKVTEGLDGLRTRFEEYFDLGARFSKWRAVIAIGEKIPSDACLGANAQALARFAALSQEADMVPIVEPEVLMDGSHSIERCEEVTERTLHFVFHELFAQKIRLEAMLLKASMVISGKDDQRQARSEEIAAATVRCLRRSVPAAVPGVVFLSGGQADVQATQNLNTIAQIGPQPWQLSFSFGRGLQDAAQKTWAGNAGNKMEAQKALLRRSKANSAAIQGSYSAEFETAPVSLRPSPVPV